ncbi:flagellar filament capping protein FliD [Hydrogenimonas thermophila]|uniref:Flagellar hook-associated protein 2 n=1 Tax=Hydrogenimonas thermophila TaxID=223786 RepID=A0A1I5L5R8_9BACT|nr:flagellar filament capping protein FliD [Hydrogenimonas thermophila]WOE70043.1 flagellar filament capping protein FliD [Hydrogenimonas thermophila]WOE72560.1 flagellar filament capping protein FliD [Hydrogenimonas thermophila]SFO92081.1 flagellar hook-associated protein 2 [Hydrogenimonas thermophila]
MADLGALSSLGIGSGTLTYDIIDKLKNADIETQITPIDNKISEIKEKESNLTTITTLTSTLKTAVVDLADSSFFEKRKVSVSGKDVTVKANDGVAVQDINLKVTQLAQTEIEQSKGFATETSSVVDKDTTMTISIDGTAYDINVKAGTTLEELRDQINESTDGNVVASILNTGGDNPYSLILKSSNTGADQAIDISYDDGDPATTNDDFLSFTTVQNAQDALFEFNGVNVTRATNTVDDLVIGVTFELTGTSGEDNRISIERDVEGIADMVSEFVSAYNSWNSNLTEATKFDPDGGTSGIFQGDSTIRRLLSDVKYALFNSEIDGKGAGTYGITVNEDGILSFDRTVFIDELNSDPEKAVEVFTSDIGGVFSSLNDTLKNATDMSTGYLGIYEEQLKREEDHLSEERERSLEMLNKRYDIMAMQFAAYDEMISNMNTSYQSLQMAIDAQLSSK